MNQSKMTHENEIRDFVSREVIYCVSSLVSTLAQTAAENGKLADGTYYEDILEICVQDDWQSPAEHEGWEEVDGRIIKKDEDGTLIVADWREACEQDNLDPYQHEAYEHWIVTGWMASKLAEKGEMVARDICGLTIWGRTTTGQAIYMDGVIQQIYKELLEG